MRSFILYAALAAVSVKAQKSGGTSKGGKDPYAYKAGAALTEIPDPLVLMPNKNIPWPSNFGGAKMPYGKIPSGCAPLEVIVARGTSEPGDLGVIVGDPVVARCKRDVGAATCRGYPVQYDATLASFMDGVGPKDIAKRVAKMKTECPNMKFIVVGYSQGGAIAAQGLTQVASAGNADKVIGVVFYAPFGNAAVPAKYSDRKLVHCASGDAVCLGGSSMSAHTSYNSAGTDFHEKTAKFIKQHWEKSGGRAS